MSLLSKVFKPDNFESHNSLKLGFMNIWGLCSNFVVCRSFLKSNSLDILVLCEKNLGDTTDSDNFSVRRYLPLIQKDSSTHMDGLTVYVKERYFFRTELISRKLCRFLLMVSTGFTLLSVLHLFPLMITFSLFVHIFLFYFIHHRWDSLYQPIR